MRPHLRNVFLCNSLLFSPHATGGLIWERSLERSWELVGLRCIAVLGVWQMQKRRAVPHQGSWKIRIKLEEFIPPRKSSGKDSVRCFHFYRSCVSWTGLELRILLLCWDIGVYHHTWFMRCWGLNPQLCTC